MASLGHALFLAEPVVTISDMCITTIFICVSFNMVLSMFFTYMTTPYFACVLKCLFKNPLQTLLWEGVGSVKGKKEHPRVS